MKQKGWKPWLKTEVDYQRMLRRLFGRLQNKISFDSGNIIEDIETAIQSPWFDKLTDIAAKSMITSARRDNSNSWREAASKSSKGNIIYQSVSKEAKSNDLYQTLLDRNKYYIKSAALDMAEKMSKYSAKSQQEGKRPEQIADELRSMFPPMSKAKSVLIARTESAKASSEMVQSQSQKLGYNWYVWKTSEDSRVRNAHRHMDGIICNYDSPPSPEKLIGINSQGNYNPGQIYNCRCYAAPLMELNDVRWPHKAYYGGRIVTLTLSAFKKVM